MKRKIQNECYRACVVKNIYQKFCLIIFLERMLITNQYVAINYCLTNSVINNLTTVLWRIFILGVFKA